MKKKTPDFPPDPRTLLNPFQRGTVIRATEKANAARQVAYAIAQQIPHPRDEEDFRREHAFVEADFQYSFRIISTLVNELRAAGIRGERLREVVKMEIWDAVTVGDLGIYYEKKFAEILIEDPEGDS
jgi:hypothetical protein